MKEKPVVDKEKPSDGMIAPFFTPEEASLILALITGGWNQAVLGSRERFEVLAAVEDKMLGAGALPETK